MNRLRTLLFVLILAASMLVAACTAPEGTTVAGDEGAVDAAAEDSAVADQPDEATVAVEEVAAAAEAVPEGRTHIRWYVGLGTGPREDLQPTQRQVVDDFNASQDDIWLTVEFIQTDQATDVLNTQIAAGNAPDVVGPMGIQGRARFDGAWLDLAPLIEANDYDLSDFDPELIDFYKMEGEGQLGIPFAVYPSFIFYNEALFDEAGLPYPPSAYGEPYVTADGEELPWDMETLALLSKQLTVDAEGNDATMPEFDPDNIVQFGFGNVFADLRGMGALFGAGNFVDDDCNAQVPEHWREAFNWYHDAMWEEYFYPNGPYGDSALMGEGNWFETGNLAMAFSHLWYITCCLNNFPDTWNAAPVPSYNGTTTAKLHAGTFGILEYTDHPEEAFEVVTYLLGEAAPTLTQLYGGLPARLSLQEGYFDQLDQTEVMANQNVNWDVVVAGLAYPDVPSHEEGMPNFLEAEDRYGEFAQQLSNDPDLDVDAALDVMVQDLQAIFNLACEANE